MKKLVATTPGTNTPKISRYNPRKIPMLPAQKPTFSFVVPLPMIILLPENPNS